MPAGNFQTWIKTLKWGESVDELQGEVTSTCRGSAAGRMPSRGVAAPGCLQASRRKVPRLPAATQQNQQTSMNPNVTWP